MQILTFRFANIAEISRSPFFLITESYVKSWKFNFSLLVVSLFSFMMSVVAAAGSKDIWVYTSVYKEYITPIQKGFEAKYPEYKLQVFQAGSEKIQAKLEAELVAGKPQADVLVISDPFYAEGLQLRGLAYSPRSSRRFGFVLLANLRLDRSSRQLPEAIVRIRFDFTCSSATGKAQNAPVLAAKARLKRSLA